MIIYNISEWKRLKNCVVYSRDRQNICVVYTIIYSFSKKHTIYGADHWAHAAFIILLSNTLSVIRHLNCHKISLACRNAPFLPWYRSLLKGRPPKEWRRCAFSFCHNVLGWKSSFNKLRIDKMFLLWQNLNILLMNINKIWYHSSLPVITVCRGIDVEKNN